MTDNLQADILRAMDRVTARVQLVRDDVHNDELDCALSHLGILRRQISALEAAIQTFNAVEHAGVKGSVALRTTESGSVECPHCHWGFDPSVITQHIREKH